MNEKSLRGGWHIDAHFKETELFQPMLEFGMSARLIAILHNEEITTFQQIRDRSDHDWHRVHNFGIKSFQELTAFMETKDPERNNLPASETFVPANTGVPVGIALRDYFAVSALLGALANEGARTDVRDAGGFEDEEAIATRAYKIADAMLEARNATKPLERRPPSTEI